MINVTTNCVFFLSSQSVRSINCMADQYTKEDTARSSRWEPDQKERKWQNR